MFWKIDKIQTSHLALPTTLSDVWRFRDSSVPEILREINLGESRKSKTADITILWPLNLVNFGIQKV